MKRLTLSFLIFVSALAAEETPEVVLILAENLGRDWISCYGAEHQTPNIDRLAAAGIRFETAWSMPDGELSRKTLMTGRYPSRHADDAPSLVDLLGDRVRIESIKRRDAPFHGYVNRVDERVGEIVDEYEKAILIFTSNDASTAAGELKTDLGVHVPFIVRAPSLKGGWVSKDLIDFTDILPTLLDVLDVNSPDGLKLDGRSFVPSLQGSDDPFEKRNWIVSESGGFRMARDWQHILDSDGNFHDLRQDPLQEREVSVQDKQAPHRKERLQMILDRFAPTAPIEPKLPK